MKKTRIEQLKSILSFLKDGEGISLGEDTFLVTGGLDGSDKCYGFTKYDGKLLCVTRECSEGYPIEEMNKGDLNYIFNGSKINGTSIIDKLKVTGKGYNVVDGEDV